MLDAAPVNVRGTAVVLFHAGATTTVSPDSRTPFRFDVSPEPCPSTFMGRGIGIAAVGVTVGVLLGVAVGGTGVRVGVFVGV